MTTRADVRIFQVQFWKMDGRKKSDRVDKTMDTDEFNATFPAFAKAGWAEKAPLGAKPLEFYHEGLKCSVKRIS